MKQNVNSAAMVAVLAVAILIVLIVGGWYVFGRSTATYGGKRTVPRRPPSPAASVGRGGPAAGSQTQ